MDITLYQKTTNIQTRWANAENPKGEKGAAAQERNGRKGKPCVSHFMPGQTLVLAEAAGSGVVRHIWITTEKRENPQTLKGHRLECFWDGAEKPAVSVPLGDFFCFNSGKMSAMENEFFSSPEGRSFNCYIPMPFRMGMKITITNESGMEEPQFFYQVDYTLGDDTADALYFHAFYNREKNTVAKRDYVILPKLCGCGRYLGASFGMISNPLMRKSWWGEGEVKCYVDGDSAFPTLAGTGTEDYIGTGWGQGRYVNRWQGCPHADSAGMRYSFYRFHGPDPVYFDEDVFITIQQIGHAGNEAICDMLDHGLTIYKADGTKVARDCPAAIIERFDDDWCSVAYFYYDKPESALPAIPAAAERIEKYDL